MTSGCDWVVFTGNVQFLQVKCLFKNTFISLCNNHPRLGKKETHHGLALHSHEKQTPASWVNVQGVLNPSTAPPSHPIGSFQIFESSRYRQHFKLTPSSATTGAIWLGYLLIPPVRVAAAADVVRVTK